MATISPELYKQLSSNDKDKAYESLCAEFNKLATEKKRYENIILEHFETKTSSSGAPVSKETVSQRNNIRRFDPKTLEQSTTNLIIGSSIIKRIPLTDLPTDVQIHSYPGSTTEEKISLIEQYEKTPLESLTIQDGTNSILKNMNTPVKDLFDSYKVLVNKAHDKFSPKNLFLMEVIPTNYKTGNERYNDRIKEFNEHLSVWHEHLQSYMSETSVTIMKTYDEMQAAKDKHPGYFHDEIHLSSASGCIHLKNLILRHVMQFSSGLPRTKPIEYPTPRFQRQYHNNYNYNSGFNNNNYNNNRPHFNNNYSGYRNQPQMDLNQHSHFQRRPAYPRNPNNGFTSL